MSKKETVFEKLHSLNVNELVEKKGKFVYLSWAYAWAELKKVAPNAEVKVYHDEVTNKPYFGLGNAGALVKVGVTVEGVEHISYLPCMDYSNKAKPESSIDAMDINKAIQRATVKAIALHGLGLYIYAGEDLPNGEENKESNKKEIKTISRRRVVSKEVKEKKAEEVENPVEKAEEQKPSGRGFRRRG